MKRQIIRVRFILCIVWVPLIQSAPQLFGQSNSALEQKFKGFISVIDELEINQNTDWKQRESMEENFKALFWDYRKNKVINDCQEERSATSGKPVVAKSYYKKNFLVKRFLELKMKITSFWYYLPQALNIENLKENNRKIFNALKTSKSFKELEDSSDYLLIRSDYLKSTKGKLRTRVDKKDSIDNVGYYEVAWIAKGTDENNIEVNSAKIIGIFPLDKDSVGQERVALAILNRTNPDPDPGTNPGPDSGTNPGPDSGTNPDPDPGTNPGPDSGTNPDPDPGTNPGPDSGTNPDPDPGTNPDPDPGTNPGPDSGTNPGPDPGTGNASPDNEEVNEFSPELMSLLKPDFRYFLSQYLRSLSSITANPEGIYGFIADYYYKNYSVVANDLSLDGQKEELFVIAYLKRIARLQEVRFQIQDFQIMDIIETGEYDYPVALLSARVQSDLISDSLKVQNIVDLDFILKFELDSRKAKNIKIVTSSYAKYEQGAEIIHFREEAGTGRADSSEMAILSNLYKKQGIEKLLEFFGLISDPHKLTDKERLSIHDIFGSKFEQPDIEVSNYITKRKETYSLAQYLAHFENLRHKQIFLEFEIASISQRLRPIGRSRDIWKGEIKFHQYFRGLKANSQCSYCDYTLKSAEVIIEKSSSDEFKVKLGNFKVLFTTIGNDLDLIDNSKFEFKIQIAAVSKPKFREDDYSSIREFGTIETEKISNRNTLRVLVGTFSSFNEARQKLKKIVSQTNFTGAFIAVYDSGTRIGTVFDK